MLYWPNAATPVIAGIHVRKEFMVACHEVTSRRIPRNRNDRQSILKRDMKSAVSRKRRLSDGPEPR